jgi:tetratricopeptide (TPR) repeat protein
MRGKPQSAGLLRERAFFLTNLGQTQQALTDIVGATEFEPWDHWNYKLLAPLLAASGEVEPYRRCCRQVIAQFGGTNDPVIAERMAKACLILPASGVDLDAVGKLAETAVAVGTNHPWFPYFQFAKGLAEYRQGRFASAAGWLGKVLDNQEQAPDDSRNVQAYLVLAMARYQLKEVALARNALTAGTGLWQAKAPKSESGRFSSDWTDWIIADALMREAKALIPEVEPYQPTTAKPPADGYQDAAESLGKLVGTLKDQGKLAEAEATGREWVFARLNLPRGKRDKGQLEQAIKAVGEAIIKDPADPWNFQARAFLFGRQAQWQAAAKDLSQAVKLDPNLPAFALGALLIETGDTAGYKMRQRMIWVNLWNTEDPETAGAAAIEVSLLPADGSSAKWIDLVETAVTRGANHARVTYFQLGRGLVEYRQGHYAGARDWVGKCLAGCGTNYVTSAVAGAVLAMAQQQLKETDDARKALAQATEIFETKLPKLESGDLGEDWPEWLMARTLLGEARRLVEGGT